MITYTAFKALAEVSGRKFDLSFEGTALTISGLTAEESHGAIKAVLELFGVAPATPVSSPAESNKPAWRCIICGVALTFAEGVYGALCSSCQKQASSEASESSREDVFLAQVPTVRVVEDMPQVQVELSLFQEPVVAPRKAPGLFQELEGEVLSHQTITSEKAKELTAAVAGFLAEGKLNTGEAGSLQRDIDHREEGLSEAAKEEAAFKQEGAPVLCEICQKKVPPDDILFEDAAPFRAVCMACAGAQVPEPMPTFEAKPAVTHLCKICSKKFPLSGLRVKGDDILCLACITQQEEASQPVKCSACGDTFRSREWLEKHACANAPVLPVTRTRVTKEEVLLAAAQPQQPVGGMGEPHQVFPVEAPTNEFLRDIYLDLLEAVKANPAHNEAAVTALKKRINDWKGTQGSTSQQIFVLLRELGTRTDTTTPKVRAKKASPAPAAQESLSTPAPASTPVIAQSSSAIEDALLKADTVREATHILMRSGVTGLSEIVSRITALQPLSLALKKVKDIRGRVELAMGAYTNTPTEV